MTQRASNGADKESRPLSLAYSPCPNDTFMFSHIADGTLDLAGMEITTHLDDVETLNRMALEGVFDVSKISFHAYFHVKDRYRLLNHGAALGFGCGPIVVSREKMSREGIKNAVIAVPGEMTTGHLLLKLWLPDPGNVSFVSYDRILPMLLSGKADAGVIIHESRFVYEQMGMYCVEDLGQWWEEKTGLPIPLGAIVARRTLGEELIERVDGMLKTSIQLAQTCPEATMPYVHAHAQEMSEKVLTDHIGMFVNDFSLDLGIEGRRAVETLERMARDSGVIT
ncbi:MAG: 1,4-dihydroxy-6-naphthoate synthase [Kiritimatiellia bacterium]|nr:1,4-dihydroxy-6-naphthoate synthase [Kiritimatiellia bacterium]